LLWRNVPRRARGQPVSQQGLLCRNCQRGGEGSNQSSRRWARGCAWARASPRKNFCVAVEPEPCSPFPRIAPRLRRGNRLHCHSRRVLWPVLTMQSMTSCRSFVLYAAIASATRSRYTRSNLLHYLTKSWLSTTRRTTSIPNFDRKRIQVGCRFACSLLSDAVAYWGRSCCARAIKPTNPRAPRSPPLSNGNIDSLRLAGDESGCVGAPGRRKIQLQRHDDRLRRLIAPRSIV